MKEQRTLEGKTLFITGASRSIGLDISLRAARDGANTIIAAKSAEPHPKLLRNIHIAAAAPEAAAEKAVARFGGINTCVNNASVTSKTATLHTPLACETALSEVISASASRFCVHKPSQTFQPTATAQKPT